MSEQRDWGLHDYLSVLRRRKWLVFLAFVLVPVAAVVFSLRQQELHQGSAEVLLSRQNLASALTGTVDPLAYQQADRLAQTQARLAQTPEVARRVLRAVEAGDMSPREFLAASDVSPQTNADLLVFSVTHPSPALARQLATEYARQFTVYRRELDTGSIERARKEVEQRLAELQADGESRSPLYASLVDKEQELRTLEALQTSNAFLVRPADEVERVQPKPLRNGVLGIMLGLVLGLGLAFLREALDTRVRSAEEIAHRLGLPLLARIPEPSRKLRSANKLVMLSEPQGHEAEAFRILRTNLEFARLSNGAKTIMVTSALEQEGKSTTVANLAVALARGGHRVVLVDLDLRRPFLDRFFDLDGRPGVTDVALGHVPLDDALGQLAIEGPSRLRGSVGAVPVDLRQTANGRHHGSLLVLPSGPIPPDPGEFVGTSVVQEILGAVRELADVVLIDAPPLLPVGDAMVLGGKLDGVFVVTKLDVVNRSVLTELARQLDRIPARKLGFVIAGAEKSEAYYGGSYAYEPRGRSLTQVAP